MNLQCARSGCGSTAVSAMQINARQCVVTLVGAPEMSQGVPLCDDHANATTVPADWELIDLRGTNSAEQLAKQTYGKPQQSIAETYERKSLGAESDKGADELAPPVINESDDQSDAVGPKATSKKAKLKDSNTKRRGGKGQPDDEKIDDVGRSFQFREDDGATADDEDQQASFPWHHRFTEDTEPESLRANSPLLARAFRAGIS